MSTKYLITGGAGMLSKAFAKLLHARGAEPVILDRSALDLTDRQKTKIAIHVYKPTIVLNCAAYTKVDQAEIEEEKANAVNGDGVENLADVCAAMNVKLVHFSTDYVFDGTLSRPLKPNDPTGPQSAYGRSKLLGETRLRESKVKDWLLIRTAWLYGPGGANFVRTMLNAARAGKPLTVVSDQIGCPTFTHDLADVTLSLIEAKSTGTFHVSNSVPTNWFEFTQAIMDEFEVKPASLTPTTSAEWKTQRPQSATRPGYSVLDCSECERATGKNLPGWRDGLHRYREFVEAHGDG